MGIESFGLLGESLTNADEKVFKEFMNNKYSVKDYFVVKRIIRRKIKLTPNTYILDNRIEININVVEKRLKFSIQGCYSDYNNNLIFIYNLLKEINLIYGLKVIILGKEILFTQFANFDEFSKTIRRIYKSGYNNFTRKYGKMNEQLLPNDDFFEYVRRNGITK